VDTITIQPSEVKLTANAQETALTAQNSDVAVTVAPNEVSLNVEPNNVNLDLQPNSVDLTVLSGATVNNYYDGGNTVVGESPNGTINGSNATFTTDFDFVPESVLFFRNGLAQYNPTHYTTSGTTTIILNFSPIVGDVLTVNYNKA